MRTAIVPAQITTVEDKVVGNLSLPQLLLLTAPIFVCGLIYVVLPPSSGDALYKTVLGVLISAALGVSAVRLRGRILLSWAAMILRYNLRPRFHVFDKNDIFLRDVSVEPVADEAEEDVAASDDTDRVVTPVLSTPETVMLEGIMANPDAKLRFVTDRKGALGVRIKEVK
jgi:hypothetical protein